MELLFNLDSKITVYFHNLKFDGEFILYWLFKNGYTFNSERKYLNEKEFTTLISDRGVFYTIEICYYKSDTKRKTLKILDSLKILPFSIAEIAKAFSLPISKLEIDYKEKREIGHELTQSEIDYIRSDVTIAALGIEKLFEQNLKKMTTGSNAITEYKKIIGKGKFSKWFPPPVYDDDIRQSYRGGFTYLNPIYKNKDIALIILDVMMPKLDGYGVAEEVRKMSDVPIIMLTAKSDERDELRGFDLGIDEYITKPFSPRILVARVEAVLRRTQADADSNVISVDGIEMDIAAHQVKVDGEPIELSYKEFELLNYFLQNRGVALSREKILNNVWNYDYFGDARTIDTHVKKLRSKLGSKGDYIKTIWGMGYKFEG